jgi:hypothetical protein
VRPPQRADVIAAYFLVPSDSSVILYHEVPLTDEAQRLETSRVPDRDPELFDAALTDSEVVVTAEDGTVVPGSITAVDRYRMARIWTPQYPLERDTLYEATIAERQVDVGECWAWFLRCSFSFSVSSSNFEEWAADMEITLTVAQLYPESVVDCCPVVACDDGQSCVQCWDKVTGPRVRVQIDGQVGHYTG